MAKSVYDHLSEGEWCAPKHRGFKLQCCDCGLVHTTWFRIFEGKVEFKMEIDGRATAAVRRAKKLKKGK